MRRILGGTELAGFRIEFHIARQHVGDPRFGRAVKSALIESFFNIALDLGCGFSPSDKLSNAQHHRQDRSATLRIPAGRIDALLTISYAVFCLKKKTQRMT